MEVGVYYHFPPILLTPSPSPNYIGYVTLIEFDFLVHNLKKIHQRFLCVQCENESLQLSFAGFKFPNMDEPEKTAVDRLKLKEESRIAYLSLADF